jgi:eukaryotic-like serine/threonine-protein kinase
MASVWACLEFSPVTLIDLWTVAVDEQDGALRADTPQPFLNTPASESYPTFSPDGHWLAYSSDESGTWEVYVRPFLEKYPKVQVSRGGGRVPFWSRDRGTLYYATDRQRIMRASYTVRHGSFVAEPPQPWTAQRIADTGVIAGLDLAPDGKRFAVLMPVETPEEEQSPNHVTMLFNFFDEVARRVREAE